MVYIIETQHRVDGQINSTMTGRQTENSGYSLFFERCSKMSMNTEFPAVDIMICDEHLNRIRPVEHIVTAYIQPTEAEVAQAQAEQAEAEQEGEVVNE